MKKNNWIYWASSLLFCLGIYTACQHEKHVDKRPNILLIMSDNQSWNHVGAYGDSIVQTPNIDQVAREGMRFTHAFCASPSCTPARAALLTGQDIYRLKQGANLWGTLPREFKTYTDLLEEEGYQIGYEGKGWGPGNFEAAGRKRNPGGDLYASFKAFLQHNKEKGAKPWHYWFSSKHPHRPYAVGSGTRSGIDSMKVKVPAYLPDVPEVRGDIADYYAAIHYFDEEVKELLEELAQSGQADNTIVIVCSDNGWQMPRGLANLYDAGTRVPLIIKWPGHIPKGSVVDHLISLNDLAPTILQLAKVRIPDNMTAKEIAAITKERADENMKDNYVVMARERHAFVRQHGLGYPARAIRTKDFLYIRNLEPGRWPAGDPPLYGDLDAHMLHYPAPTKIYLLANEKNPSAQPLFKLAFAKRPLEELYDLRYDADQLRNVADSSNYRTIKQQLVSQLDDYLKKTSDPRVIGGPIIWDTTAYFEPRDFKPHPSEEAKRKLHLKDDYDYLK